MLSYVRLWGPSSSKGQIAGHILKENHPMSLFHQNLVLIEQMVSDKKIFMRISYVKLSSAVVAILVRDLK